MHDPRAFPVEGEVPSAYQPTGMHVVGMQGVTGIQVAGMHVTGMHDPCACALFSVMVASIAGAMYAEALRKWRRARSSSFISPASFIAV